MPHPMRGPRGTWQKINHRARKPAAAAVFITEAARAAYKSARSVYRTWEPALPNTNTIPVCIISMLIRSITTDIVSCHSIVMLIKQTAPWGEVRIHRCLITHTRAHARAHTCTKGAQRKHAGAAGPRPRTGPCLVGSGRCCCDFVSGHYKGNIIQLDAIKWT